MRTIEGTTPFDKTTKEGRNREWGQIHSKWHRCCEPAPGNDRREDADSYRTLGVAYLHHANLDQILRACSETEPCAALRDSGPCNQSAPLWSTAAVAPVPRRQPRRRRQPSSAPDPLQYPASSSVLPHQLSLLLPNSLPH